MQQFEETAPQVSCFPPHLNLSAFFCQCWKTSFLLIVKSLFPQFSSVFCEKPVQALTQILARCMFFPSAQSSSPIRRKE
jgi:hypothetical protein